MSRFLATLSRAVAQRRSFSSTSNALFLEKSEVQSRVMSVLQSKSFVDIDKVTPTAQFFYDLNLDELHSQEINQALGAEFCVTIPETAAINSVNAAVSFISSNPLAK